VSKYFYHSVLALVEYTKIRDVEIDIKFEKNKKTISLWSKFFHGMDKINRIRRQRPNNWAIYSVSLFDFSSFLPKRVESQNLERSIGNFGCLAVWVKKRSNRKNSRLILFEMSIQKAFDGFPRNRVGSNNYESEFEQVPSNKTFLMILVGDRVLSVLSIECTKTKSYISSRIFLRSRNKVWKFQNIWKFQNVRKNVLVGEFRKNNVKDFKQRSEENFHISSYYV
jgi:hypothetical protein